MSQISDPRARAYFRWVGIRAKLVKWERTLAAWVRLWVLIVVAAWVARAFGWLDPVGAVILYPGKGTGGGPEWGAAGGWFLVAAISGMQVVLMAIMLTVNWMKFFAIAQAQEAEIRVQTS